MRKLAPHIAIATLLAATASLHAGEVRLLFNSTNVYAGVPFPVAIKVTEEDRHAPPEFPALDNADVQAGKVSSSTNSSFQITFNGKRVGSTRKTTQYLFHVTPHEPGLVHIPAIEVEVDGETLRTKPAVFRATKSDTGDLMFVELAAPQSTTYVGQGMDVTLEIWLAVFEQQGKRLSGSEMWGLIDKQASRWGPFFELIDRRRPDVTVRNDQRIGDNAKPKNYYVFQLKTRVWAKRPGPLIPEPIRIVAQYPISLQRSRDFFSFQDWQVREAKPISAALTGPQPEVKPLPTEGRPPYFTGAIGPHSIQTTAAPTKARVGDPITLTITVAGRGQLELLQAPNLSELPQFSDRFQVTEDQLPGVVEGNRKRFMQSIRALTDDVVEIPPVPFAYFDPAKEAYVTVYSKAIPIEIAPAERMSVSQIVEAGEPGQRAVGKLTALQAGIEGNYTDPEALLVQQVFQPASGTFAIICGAPAVYLAGILIQRRRRKLSSSRAFVRQRNAKKIAMRRLRDAGSGLESQSTEVMAALLGYVADKLDLPAGGLTRGDAVAQLKQRSVADELIGEIDSVLMSYEAARYAGDASVDADGLLEQARRCIDRLERVKF